MQNSEKYDVAISLRWTDVERARELYDLLRDRLDVFFSDEKQEDIVGKDGEEKFGRVFRDEARVVVVFYRPGWGDTPFTRAEESAIRQRAWDESYDFSIWVPMDEEKSVPSYLPPQYLWLDLEQYGMKGLASVVEERVRESGQEVRPERIEDRLRRKSRQIQLEEKRKAFEESENGVQFMKDDFGRLNDLLEERIKKYEAINDRIQFNINEDRRKLSVSSRGFACEFHLNINFRNSVSGASLTARLKEFKRDRGRRGDWATVQKTEFQPTLDNSGEPAWRLSDGDFYSLEMVLSYVLDDMAERVYDAVKNRLD